MAIKRLQDMLEGILALACVTTVFFLSIADAPVPAASGTTMQAAPSGR